MGRAPCVAPYLAGEMSASWYEPAGVIAASASTSREKGTKHAWRLARTKSMGYGFALRLTWLVR
jgi:hypothetical protein